MRTRNLESSLLFAVALVLAIGLSVAVRAQQAGVPAPTPDARPTAGPFRVESVDGRVGATESGPAVGAAAEVTTAGDHEQFFLEMYTGKPVLRIEAEGRSTRIDIGLYHTDWQSGDTSGNGENATDHAVDLEIRPLQGRAHLSIPVGGDFRGKLIITPEFAAAYHLVAGDGSLTAEAFAGVAAGVAGDNDGAAGVLGLRFGARIRGEYRFDDHNKLIGQAELEQILALAPMGNTLRFTGSVLYEHVTRNERGVITNSWGVGPFINTDSMNVERSPNADSGRATVGGITARWAFSAF